MSSRSPDGEPSAAVGPLLGSATVEIKIGAHFRTQAIFRQPSGRNSVTLDTLSLAPYTLEEA